MVARCVDTANDSSDLAIVEAPREPENAVIDFQALRHFRQNVPDPKIDSLAPARSVAPQPSAPPNSSRRFPSRSNLPHPGPLPKERGNHPPTVGCDERSHRFMVPMHAKKSKGGSS